jgi:hypothetical protein
VRYAALLLALSASSGCGVVGPSCMDRRQSGHVTTVSGAVPPGALVRHDVPYALEGSQNNVEISWTGQRLASPPRLAFYATRRECAAFDPVAADGACAILARAGWTGGVIAPTLIVTNGRGNPDVLGTPPAYTIWIAGDATVAADYTLDITWFFGPDC